MILSQGVSVLASAELTISEALGIERVNLYAPERVASGQEIPYELSAELKSGELTFLRNADIQFRVVEESEDGVVTVQNGINVIAQKPGTAKICAEAACRGKTFESNAVTVTVTKGAADYSNFSIVFKTGAYPSETISAIEDLKDYGVNRSWAFVESTLKSSYPVSYIMENFLQAVGSAPGQYIALKAKVSSAGEYQLSVDAYSNERSCILGAYVLPYTDENLANIAAGLNEESLIGRADMQKGAAGNYLYEFGRASFPDVGECLIVLRAEGTDSGEYVFYPSELLFENVNSLKSVAITCDKDTLSLGESTQTSLRLYRTDGQEIPLDAKDLEELRYSSDNPQVASVDEAGVVTGHTEGVANIKVLISRSGIVCQGSVAVTVTDGSELTGASLDAPESIWIYGQCTVAGKAGDGERAHGHHPAGEYGLQHRLLLAGGHCQDR